MGGVRAAAPGASPPAVGGASSGAPDAAPTAGSFGAVLKSHVGTHADAGSAPAPAHKNSSSDTSTPTPIPPATGPDDHRHPRPGASGDPVPVIPSLPLAATPWGMPGVRATGPADGAGGMRATAGSGSAPGRATEDAATRSRVSIPVEESHPLAAGETAAASERQGAGPTPGSPPRGDGRAVLIAEGTTGALSPEAHGVETTEMPRLVDQRETASKSSVGSAAIGSLPASPSGRERPVSPTDVPATSSEGGRPTGSASSGGTRTAALGGAAPPRPPKEAGSHPVSPFGSAGMGLPPGMTPGSGTAARADSVPAAAHTFHPPAPEPTRPPAPPARVEAWLDHPTNGALQIAVVDNGVSLGLMLQASTAGLAKLADAGVRDDLRDILSRASQGDGGSSGSSSGQSGREAGGHGKGARP
jgi:hypothetical protein